MKKRPGRGPPHALNFCCLFPAGVGPAESFIYFLGPLCICTQAMP